MEPFRYHVFACAQQKPEGVTSCPANGSMRALDALRRELQAKGLDDEVQVTTCGCLGLCENGPVFIVYPEGIWYRTVKAEDVPEIVDSHFCGGKVVSRLVWTDAPEMKRNSLEHGEQYRAMMKARDKAGILPDDLNETTRAFMSSRALLTALELDLFTVVGSGASAEQVAGKLNTNPRATEMLLNALTSLKLLEKTEDVFKNTVATARFFAEGSKDNARGGLLHTADLWHHWSTLTDCVRVGTSVQQRKQDGESVRKFIAAMDRNAKERARVVVNAIGADGIRRVLDLGGGSGAYSIAIANAAPAAKAEILDVPDVVPLTQEYIRKAGLADRISVRPGDMLRDSLGEGYDLVLLNAICHMFSPEENRALFQRAYSALVPNGRLVMQDFILAPDKASPQFAALFSLNMLVNTRAGSSYSEVEYDAWLRGAGFAEVVRTRIPGPSGLIVAMKK